MRILIFTQKVDSRDTILGFFHEWIDRLSYHFDSVDIICLQKGENNLPKNVTIHEIGKQTGYKKINYVVMVFKYLYELNGNYDRVFVHMNQEYVLLGGLYWMAKNIPVFMWRNHKKGSVLTNISVFFSKKVFCTSRDSYTSKFSKTVIMPAGIDTSLFKINKDNSARKKYSICMVGRISPVKRVEKGLEVIKDLVSSGMQINFGVVGPVLKKDEEYFQSLKQYVLENNLSSFVSFLQAVEPDKLPEVYGEYQICLNLTDSGSFDKTVVESTGCGAVPLVVNKSMKGLLPDACITEDNLTSIKNSLKNLLDDKVRIDLQDDLEKFAKSQSLDNLITKLTQEIKNV